jgi:hypothetical protein
MAGLLWPRVTRGLARVRWSLAGLGALVIVLACVLVIPRWLVRQDLGVSESSLRAAEKAKVINDIRTTLLQGIAGTVILLGAYFTYRQVQIGREQLSIAQQGQVTERFTRAIDQLGHAELDVQLGGIYALERIAKDSPDDWVTIADVLTAFVRGHAPWPPELPRNRDHRKADIENLPYLDRRLPSVQAALWVLARMPERTGRRHYLDLRATDLRKARLLRADLRRVDFSEANLQGSNLIEANLERSFFAYASLQGAYLRDANLQRTVFFGADLTGADLNGSNLLRAHDNRNTTWPPEFTIEQRKEAGIVRADDQKLEDRRGASTTD